MTAAPPVASGHRVAVDIGGTFTDAVCADDAGRVWSAKAPSIPGRQDESVIEAVARLGVTLDTVQDFVHGTTAALNALLERRGARLAMLVTAGFRDVYEIRRANRPEMYDIHWRRPEMLLRRRDIFELDERLAADGSVLVPVDEAAVREIGSRLAGTYDAVAVCLLNAYASPAHEARVSALLREVAPEIVVVTSSEVAPEWREYERWSSTLVSAYVAPTIGDYLGRLDARLTADGLATPLHVMQSNGGVMTARMAVRRAVQTLFSGPVGGTIACVAIGLELEEDRLICVDMGGTSFDVSLVVDGSAEVESQIEIEGHPVLISSVSMHSLGAGGGSIAHVSSGGLRVGPTSAGSFPGPACYGNGGTRPTVTDANVALGRIPADARLAGSLALDLDAARAALASVADELGLGVQELAEGVIAVADAMMADAIREVTVARGIDPRDFSLLAFGGAGPLHAVSLAEELDIGRVIVPAEPGALSAWGMLQANMRHDLVRAVYGRVGDIPAGELESVFADLAGEAAALLSTEGVADGDMVLEPSADLRYVGQEYTLNVPVRRPVDEGAQAELGPAFAAAHLRRYGHNNPGEAVEVVNLRVTALGLRQSPPRTRLDDLPAPAPRALVEAVFGGELRPCALYRRGDLGRGARVEGPSIVLEDGCTTLVPPGWAVSTSPHGHLILERAGA